MLFLWIMQAMIFAHLWGWRGLIAYVIATIIYNVIDFLMMKDIMKNAK